MRAKTLTDLRTSPPWCEERLILAGTIVEAEPADNLPVDSLIKYWVHPAPWDTSDWAQDSEGPYGVGAYASDLEILKATRQ